MYKFRRHSTFRRLDVWTFVSSLLKSERIDRFHVRCFSCWADAEDDAGAAGEDDCDGNCFDVEKCWYACYFEDHDHASTYRDS